MPSEKVYVHATGGLGDVLAEFFCAATQNQPRNPQALSRMLRAWQMGDIEQAAVVYRSGCPNPAVPQLFAGLGLRTYIADYRLLAGIPDVKDENFTGWVEAKSLTDPPEIAITECPVSAPLVPIPKRYILLNESASHPERRLADIDIYRAIKVAAPGIPVVKVGTQRPVIPADIELTDRSTACETAWLAQHAALIVSAATFHRCWSSIFGTRVFELLDSRRALPTDIERTAKEYEMGRYGVTPEKNKWMMWPECREELISDIRQTLTI